MIQINDNDLPITVAEKIIKGTKPYKASPLVKKVAEVITGENIDGDCQQDMFDYDEIVEIRDYLTVWIENNEDRD